MNIFDENYKVKILCVGVGESSCNLVSDLSKKGFANVSFITANADKDFLEMDKLKSPFQNADLMLIVTSLESEIETSRSLQVTKIAKEKGTLTIGIVAIKVTLKGKREALFSQYAFQRLKRESGSLMLVGENEQLVSAVESVINTMAGILHPSGDNDITLDFEDIRTIMSHSNIFLLGVGEDKGENAAYTAMKQVIKCSFTKDKLMSDIKGALVHFKISPEFKIMNLAKAMELINENVHKEAEVIWGTSTDDLLSHNYVKVSIIFTRYGRDYED